MIRNIIKGFQEYSIAFSLLSKLRLWAFFAIPIAISFFLGILILFTAYALSDNLGNFISNIWVFSWGKETFGVISTILSGLLIIALGIVIFKHTLMALAAPFMSPISEKIEIHYLGKLSVESSGFKAQTSALARGIRVNARNLAMELLLIIPLFLLSFIPLVGFIATILIFLVQAYYAGFGNMDYTLERYYKYRESIYFVKQNRGIAIGNGIGFMLMLFIPVLGILIVLPISVVASTVSTLKIIHPEKFEKKKLSK